MTPKNVVVIEGMDGVGKSSVAARLVEMLGPRAKLHYSLPDTMKEVRGEFDAMDEDEKRQFYMVGNCVSMAKANSEYNVFDRSYASTLAYHRGTVGNQEHLTPLKWPTYLKPQHYFYLHCDEAVRQTRLNGRNALTPEEIRLAASNAMRDEIDWTYRNFEDVKIMDVSKLSIEEAASLILKAILPYKNTFTFQTM